MKSRWNVLMQSIGTNKYHFIWAGVAIGIATIFSYAGPQILRFTIDSIIGNEPVPQSSVFNLFFSLLGDRALVQELLWLPGILIIIFTVLSGVFMFFSAKATAAGSEATAKSLRDRLYDHLQKLPYEYHVSAETGDLIQRSTSDVETVRKFLSIQVAEVARGIFMIALALPLMLSLSVKMTIAATTVIPFLFCFSFIFFQKVQKAFQESDEAEGRLSTVLQENLSGMRVVRAFARQEYEYRKFDTENQAFRDKTYRLIQLLAVFWSVSDFVSLLQIAAIVVLGSIWAVNGSITVGTLVVFISYEAMLLWPIRQMGRILADMGKSLVSLGRIGEVLDNVQEPDENMLHKPKITGKIEFQNVSFEYEKDRKVLENINMSIAPGEKLGIMGHTGAGKSTLVQLLVKLYECTSGRILIDGIDIREIDRKWLRKNIGLLLQESFLYAKSIKENISFANQEAADVEIFEAARDSAVHNVILKFNEGYQTLVGEKGVTLSGGQKQRVAIARTLVRNAKVLIFDDSLSAVDTETEAVIKEALEKRNTEITTILISHRVSSLLKTDKIAVLEQGRIVQYGSPGKLLMENGPLKRIWKIQNPDCTDSLKGLGSVPAV
ncbi:MAG: ABC transporter ATP-binding protein [Spirochaetia bacterium]